MSAAQDGLRDGLERTLSLVPKQGYVDAMLGAGQFSGPFALVEAGLRLPHSQAVYADAGWTRLEGWNAGIGWKWNFELP